MFSLLKPWRAFLCAGLWLGGVVGLAQAQPYPGLGRTATASEVAAWDIDVRPDFKGLPAGLGSVAQGQGVWESKCASCHGVFGESGEVFNPLVGGTTAQDVQTGRVASLKANSFPGRTTLMKLSSVATLWDYINRAMPWNAPKSLTANEVYAVSAYLLNLGGVLPDDFVFSNTNIATVQARLPNRNGLQTRHDLWPDRHSLPGQTYQPDVHAKACQTHCAMEVTVLSSIPDHARNNSGNLALQNRLVGPQRGVDTTQPTGVNVPVQAASAVQPPAGTVASNPPTGAGPAAIQALLRQNNCTGCHAQSQKILGPAFQDIAIKYAGQVETNSRYLADKIRAGSTGVWGAMPMPAQNLSEAEAATLAHWLATGAVK